MIALIAADKFKGSLSAGEVCKAIGEGLSISNPGIKIISVPLADGGDGTAKLLTQASGGKWIVVKAMDPLFREIESGYGISNDGKTAFIEMANVSGLLLLEPEERNPLHTTTFGVGQLIVHAMENGANHIVLGIGGSATNDAGIGMAEALGYSFSFNHGEKLKSIGKNLVHLSSFDTSSIHPMLSKTKFTVLCDVLNPLHGMNGAAFIYGPQKGAHPQDVEWLDAGLKNFEVVVGKSNSVDVNFPGAGAAGGMGGGTRAFLHAEMTKGFDFISSYVNLEEKIKKSDWVVTGEGKIDDQSNSGKIVAGVSHLAGKFKKPCIAMAGQCALTSHQIHGMGLSRVVTLTDGETSEEESIRNAATHLKIKASKLLLTEK